MIEFRDLNNPTDVILIHSLAPHEPGRLCTVSPSTLLYVDKSKKPYEVHMLDCSETKPKPSVGPRNVEVGVTGRSTCFVKDGNEQLLMIAEDHLYAYDLVEGKLKYHIKCSNWSRWGAVGVASDGRGHMFVCKGQTGSIDVYSVSDGKSLGCLIRKGEQGMGCPYRVQWCETKSSLVVAHITGWKWSISTIHLHYG